MGRMQMGIYTLLLSGCIALPPTPSSSSAPSLVTSTPVAPPLPSSSASLQASDLPSATSQPPATASPTPEPTPWPPSYPVEVVAGSGRQGFQDGPALQASFNKPGKPCLDPRDGSIYIPDTHMLRKLTPDGQIITVAGSQEAGYQDGPAHQARFNVLRSCAVDQKGNVFLTDIENTRLRQLSPSGEVITVLGTGENMVRDGQLGQAAFSVLLTDVTVLSAGDLMMTDGCHLRHYKNGRLTTLNPQQRAGVGAEAAIDGELSTKALFGDILWLTKDTDGNLYVADVQVRAVRQIDPQGLVKTFFTWHKDTSSSAQNIQEQGIKIFPTDVSFDAQRKRLYLTDLADILEIELDGSTKRASGNNVSPKEKAPFTSIRLGSLAMGKDHHLYVVDSGSHQLKRVVLPPP